MRTKLRQISLAFRLAILMGGILAFSAFPPRGLAEEKKADEKEVGEKKADGKNEQQVDPEIQKLVDQILSLPLPKKTIPVAVCPFTNSSGELTTLSLSVHLPTVFRSLWGEKRMRNGPDEVLTYQLMGRKKLMDAGQVFTAEDAISFARSLGCRNYATARVEASGGKVSAKVLSTLGVAPASEDEPGTPVLVEEIQLPESDISLLPGRIAAAILRQCAFSKPTAQILERVQRPVVRDPGSLAEGLRLTRFWFTVDSCCGSLKDLKELLEHEPELDYLWPSYFTWLNSNNQDQCVKEAEIFLQSHKSIQRFKAVYASLLQGKRRNLEALQIILPMLREDPGAVRFTWVAARAAKDTLGIRNAYPLYERMLELAPENSWVLYAVGEVETTLAWDYRGTEFADKVTTEGFEGFNKYLKKASKHLKKSVSMDPSESAAYQKLISVGLGLGWPYKTVHDYFRKSVALNPNDRNTYYSMQIYLLPRWHGSYRAARAFWKEVEAIQSTNPYIYTLAVDYHFLESGLYSRDAKTQQFSDDLFRKYYADPNVWQDIQAAYKKFFSFGKEDARQRATYGSYASAGKHYDIAFEQLELSKMQFPGNMYFPPQIFMYYYVDAAWETQHYERCAELADKAFKMNHCGACNNTFRTWRDDARKKIPKK